MSKVVLVSIMGLGLFLRIWRIEGWGGEALLYFDELLAVRGAMEILEGVVPWTMFWPATPYLFLLAISYTLFIFATNTGPVLQGVLHKDLTVIMGMLDSSFISFYNDPSVHLIIARFWSVIFGVAGIWAIFRLGERLHNRSTGLFAALALSLSPLHVEYSHFASAYSMALFFVLIALNTMLQVGEGEERRVLFRAGFWTGLAIATRFNALFIVLSLVGSFFVALFQGLCKGRIWSAAFLTVGGLLSGVLLGCPYLATNVLLVTKALFTATVVHGFGSPWDGFYTLGGFLLDDLGFILFVFSVFGMVLFIRKRSTKFLVLLPSFLLGLFVVAEQSRALSPRYVIFLLPWIFVSAGYFVSQIHSASSRLWLIIFLSCVAVSIPFWRSVEVNRNIRPQHTAVVSKEWIEGHIPSGSTIIMPYASLALAEDKESLRKRYESITSPYAYQEKYLSQTGVGKPLGEFVRGGEYPYAFFTNQFMQYETAEARRALFLMHDKNPREPSYGVIEMAESGFWMMVTPTRGEAMFKDGEADVFVDTRTHPSLGVPAWTISPGNRFSGSPFFVYVK